MRIDVHSHHYPLAYLELLVKLGRSDINLRAAHSDDCSQRIERQDACGIHKQILSPIGMDTIVANRKGALKAARCVNDAYAQLLSRYPSRLGAFRWVPLPYTGDAIEEAVRCLDELSFDGIGLACSYQERSLDDPEFEEFWAEMNRRNAVIYIHPVGKHSCCHWGTDKYTLDIMIGSPNQEAIAASRLVYSAIPERYPNIRFVFAGCGGSIALLWEIHENLLKDAFKPGMSLQGWARELDLDPTDPLKGFRQFWYDSAAQGSDLLLQSAIKHFGTERILLGSDSPHGSESAAIDHIKSCPHLNPSEVHSILDVNAAQLLNNHPTLPLGAVKFKQ